jgi:hypothetical protein
MDEFWVCPHCRSLNRAGAARCYRCRNKYGSRPADGSPANTTAAAPTSPPPGPLPGLVIGSAQAPYLSLPLTPTSVTAPAGTVIRAPREPFHLPSPVASVRGRVARSVAMRQAVSVVRLGYVTATLLAIVLALGAILVLVAMPAATHLLQDANAETAWAQLSAGQQGLLGFLSVALVVAGLLALLCFSVFVGLTTHNATGLGADRPMLTPYRAGTCWAGALWTQARIGAGLTVPAALIWQGYTIPGLLVALVDLEIAHRHVDDFFGWLTRPARHLPDLYRKLGVEGSSGSRAASVWSACFRLANVMAIAVCALPLLVLTAFAASVAAGGSDTLAWPSTGLGPTQLVVAVLVVGLTGCTAGSIGLLVPITLGLMQRQRTRKTLARVDPARTWVARPGEGRYAPASPNDPASDSGYDEDRIVERLATPGADAYSGPPDDRLGFGSPSPGDPGQDGPGQASLYSPSTTSSFPWSGGPPAEPD